MVAIADLYILVKVIWFLNPLASMGLINALEYIELKSYSNSMKASTMGIYYSLYIIY